MKSGLAAPAGVGVDRLSGDSRRRGAARDHGGRDADLTWLAALARDTGLTVPAVRFSTGYSQTCPVALAHNRIGMSIGGTARRLCSLCGG